MRSKLLIIILTVGFSAKAQDYAAFNNISRDFTVFQNGNRSTIEALQVDNFQVGGQGVAYIDQTGRFKIYSKGKVIDSRFSDPTDFIVTDYNISLHIGEQIRLFENGSLKTVTNWAQNYKISDSIMAYNDQVRSSFHIYYGGKDYVMEESVAADGIAQYWVGDNLVAYIDNGLYLKVFYHGKVSELLFDVPITGVKMGQSTLAYVNENLETFEVFHDGKYMVLEEFVPTFYEVGDNLIAYYNAMNELKIFYKGKVHDMGLFVPSTFMVKDNMVIFNQDNIFKVFYEGQTYDLEGFIPPTFKADFKTLVYTDNYGRLKGFKEGKKITVTNEVVSSYWVNLNTVTFETINRNSKVFYQGKIH